MKSGGVGATRTEGVFGLDFFHEDVAFFTLHIVLFDLIFLIAFWTDKFSCLVSGF